MAKATSRTRGRILSRLTVAALAAALVGTTAGAAQAGETPKPHGSIAGAQNGIQGNAAAPQKSRAAAPRAVLQPLLGVTGDNLYVYDPDWKGGYQAGRFGNDTWGGMKAATQTNHTADGIANSAWAVTTDGDLYHLEQDHNLRVGGGWNIYNRIFSPGNLAGAQGYDLLARDGEGVLWLYLGYENGDVTKRYKVGGGWGQYTQITGLGDITADGTPDIVARDSSGTLWLYEGTGVTAAPLKARVKVGGGWNTYNTLVGTGDLDGDDITDLVARGTDGSLWRYSGTGNAKAPYKARVKIGTSGWNKYRLLF
ncbi:FG-GAP repeat domain-containing protein [Streptomyces sp. NPDC087440]|uniref:FG-GAP repeat domain-containing protein n=1 Tax=Streptomyces sp. NPDC087440 TaxID=3365790 RepID=UPI0038052513